MYIISTYGLQPVEAEHEQKNIAEWCRSHSVRYGYSGLSTMHIIINNDIDKLAFKLKFDKYIYKK